MSMFTSTRWAARQTVRAIVEFKGLFLMALSLAGLALTIPFKSSMSRRKLKSPSLPIEAQANSPSRNWLKPFQQTALSPTYASCPKKTHLPWLISRWV
mgnify:CR=1 FL=1